MDSAPGGRSAPVGIVTPEAVALDFETAGVPSRALAQAVDLGVRFGGLVGASMVAGFLATAVGDTAGTVLLLLAAFALLFVYPVVCEVAWDGRTVGKRATGLRVVGLDGAPVTVRQAAIRSMLGVVDFLVPPVGVTATTTVLLSRKNQRLGDIFAGTVVLRERTGAQFPVPVAFQPPPGYERYAATLDVGALAPRRYALIRSFLLRVQEMAPEARARLTVELADRIAADLNHQPPAGVTPATFLVCTAAAYQARYRGAPPPNPRTSP